MTKPAWKAVLVSLVLLPFALSCSKKTTTGPSGGGGGGGGTATVRHVTLTTSRTQIQPNNVDYATLRATATDSAGKGVSGAVVHFTSKLGTGVSIIPDSGLADSAGQVVTTLKSTRTGVDSITASVGTYSAKVQINYTGYTLTIDSLASSVPPGQTTVVRATLRDSVGNPVQGTLLSYYVTAGHGSQIFNLDSLRRTDGAGHGRAPYWAGPTTGFDTVTVKEPLRNLSDQTIISIGGGAPEDTIPAAIIIESISSYFLTVRGGGGTESSTIKIKVLNRNGTGIKKAVRVDFVFVQPLGGGEFFAPSSANTDTAGTLTTALNTGTVSGTVKFKAIVYGRSIETSATQITIRSGPPDPAHFTLLTQYCVLPGRTGYLGDESQITVFLGDIWGNPVGKNTSVWFFTDQCMIYPGNAQTDDNGKCTNIFRTARPNDSTYATVTAETRDDQGNRIRQSLDIALYGLVTPSTFTLSPTNWVINKNGSPQGIWFTLTASDDRGLGLPGIYTYSIRPEGWTDPLTETWTPVDCPIASQHRFFAGDTISVGYQGPGAVVAQWQGLHQSLTVVDSGQIVR
jgi:hypothetical protein